MLYTSRKGIQASAGPIVGLGILVLQKVNWAVKVVFLGEEVYLCPLEDRPDHLNWASYIAPVQHIIWVETNTVPRKTIFTTHTT